MIQIYIKNAIKDIEQLTLLTQQDLEDIQKSNHDEIGKRVQKKNHLTISFETNKSLLNDELAKQVKNSTLEDVLTPHDKEYLEELKSKLSVLKNKNKEYAKYVVKINEFYTSLFDEMFRLDRDGYKVSQAKPASVFAVSA